MTATTISERSRLQARPDRTPYRAGIIGLSWIGADPPGPATDPLLGTAIPFSHASAMSRVADLDLVAVCDVAPEALDRFGSQWAERWPDYGRYADYREMLARERLDILSVVTPDDMHTEVVLAAIDAGVRAIYCEKPLATAVADVDRIIAAADRAGVVINVNFTRRWSPEYRLARQLAHDGSIGRLHIILCRHGGERAMLFRNGTHYLDLLAFLTGSCPSWVIAETDPEHHDYGPVYRGDGGHSPASEPGYSCYVAFEDGVRAFVADSKHICRDWAVDLIGDRGRVSVTAAGTVLSTPVEGGAFASRRILPQYTTAGMEAALAELIDAMEGRGEVSSSPRDARISVALAEAILVSQSTGNRPVALSCGETLP